MDVRGQVLISAEELGRVLADDRPGPTLLDVRWRLGGPPGRSEYEAGHIPSAVFVDLDRDLADSPGEGRGGRHPLPSADAFGVSMRRLGVSGHLPVVCYDQRDSTSAARCWWLLTYFGHPSVRVLDGGLAAWIADGGELSKEQTIPATGDFRPRRRLTPRPGSGAGTGRGDASGAESEGTESEPGPGAGTLLDTGPGAGAQFERGMGTGQGGVGRRNHGIATGTDGPAAGIEAESEENTSSPGESTVVVDADQAAAVASRGILLDARAGERYRGEIEPVDPVAGHIPGALSAPTTENLDQTGRFLPPAALKQRFAALGVKTGTPIAVYCGSGVTATHEILALRLAGIDAALYAGSWSEWITDPSRPIAIGPYP